MGIDVWEVIEAAKTKPFGFQAFYPGPGLGGHCIPIDPFYLTWAARKYGVNTRFIELAGEINTAMPQLRRRPRRRGAQRATASRSRAAGSACWASPTRRTWTIRASRRRSRSWRCCKPAAPVVAYNDPHVPALPRHAPSRALAAGQQAADAGVPGGAGLRADRHRSLGLRLRRLIAEHAQLIVDTRNATAGLCGGRMPHREGVTSLPSPRIQARGARG